MTPKPINERAQAKADVEDAIEYYLRQAGESAAMGFLDALEATYREMEAFPAIGSPRYGEVLAIDNLRSRTLSRYPYLVIYIERDDHLDVWRVLHGHRDIPPLMRGP